MIRKSFLLKIFDAANMQRWNDKIRPVELRELDKQAHKMIIAYMLGKFEEEQNNQDFDWIEIIEGGIFGFLQRLVITDLKPQLLDKIKKDKDKYQQLNKWTIEQIKSAISPIGDEFCQRFEAYLLDPNENINHRILNAAHLYATTWEFAIIERANPNGYEIGEIKNMFQEKKEEYYDLEGMRQVGLYSDLRNFIDLCGQLRFQIRWSHLYILPRVSVLGHMLIVAMLSYLFSMEIGACRQRCVNNYFTGLFHDLPEVLTRDIIHPVKSSVSGLSELIKEYEEQEMQERIYNLIPNQWHSDMKMFTENEFNSIVTINGKREARHSDEISVNFNQDIYNPRDGEIVKAVDRLGAFIEAHLASESGITKTKLVEAKNSIRAEFKGKTISGINFGEIYADFDPL